MKSQRRSQLGSQRIAMGLVCSLLFACGGGGSSTAVTSGGTTGGAVQSGANAGSSFAPVTASVTQAPADNASVTGDTVLRIDGANIDNAELLPSTGYTPRLGQFTVAPDHQSATLTLHSTDIPNGLLSVRISAWNAPAGTNGASEAVAMAARTWVFSNDPPPVGNSEGRAARCAQMSLASTAPETGVPVVCISALPTSTPLNQCSHFDTGFANPQDRLPVLRDGSLISKLYCEPGANNGMINPGCVCVS